MHVTLIYFFFFFFRAEFSFLMRKLSERSRGLINSDWEWEQNFDFLKFQVQDFSEELSIIFYMENTV